MVRERRICFSENIDEKVIKTVRRADFFLSSSEKSSWTEDIFFSLVALDLKRKPYLRADAARRNRHKTHELMKQIHRDAHTGVNNGTASEVHF